MMDETTKPAAPAIAENYSRESLQDLVFENEQGSRQPRSVFVYRLLLVIAFCWTIFQLWVASPFNYSAPAWLNGLGFIKQLGITVPVLSSDDIRPVHLAFAMFLAFLAYPASKRSPRMYIPLSDWVLATLAASAALYCFFFADSLAGRAGRPIQQDVIIGWIGLVLLLETTRRSLGLPLVIISIVCFFYVHYGYLDIIPDSIRHKGHSLSKMATHMWLTQEGVFGIALGVSASFVFLFVLFGSLLEKAGAGNYFIKIAFSLLGRLRGGPAKAAVIASGLTGLISASSIANVVTTGTFTIPLMKRAGFSAEKAGAIEVAAGVDGQIMPPVMGTAAFLMVEYTGISYASVIKHAFLPAILSYAALLYIVHLEALKTGARPLFASERALTMKALLIRWGIIASSILIFAGIIYYGITGMKMVLGDGVEELLLAGVIVSYFLLIRYACRYPEIVMDDPSQPLTQLPNLGETVKAGLYYLLPIFVLIWCLMIERFSPGTAAFWGIMVLIFIITTQPLLKEYFRGTRAFAPAWKRGKRELRDGLIAGARNMIGVAAATAASGIVIGAFSLTGIGNVLIDFVDSITGDSLLILLSLTALICLLLGTGMPTTASYIIVAALMAPIVKELGRQNGLDVPLIAIHLFVFYFGIMADVTPPVGLAAFAAAAISGADPMRTGWRAFTYCMRTAMLPFFFIYNTELLMVGVNDVWHALWVFSYSITGIMLFCTVLQRYFIIRNTYLETAVLLATSLLIMIPNVCNDWINPPHQKIDISTMPKAEFAVKDEKAALRIYGTGRNQYGDTKPFQLYIPTKGETNVTKILKNYGLTWRREGRIISVREVKFGTPADHADINDTYIITKIKVPQAQPSAKIMYIPAMLMLVFVIMSQLARRRKETALGMLA